MDGVKVHTNIPDIYAAGDAIESTDQFTGHTRVLGQIAAYNMLSPDHKLTRLRSDRFIAPIADVSAFRIPHASRVAHRLSKLL